METDSNKRIVTLNIDLISSLAGFESATKPTPAHYKVMKNYASPLIMGPPPSHLLMNLVLHMFTDEEAALVAHLPPLRPRTAQQVARRAGYQVENAARVLDFLADTKHVIVASGSPRKYTILPVVPGTFEMATITTDPASYTSWHITFSELFEKLWDTGYIADYPGRYRHEPVRYLPVGQVTKSLYMAWPSDQLEEILEPFDLFAVGHCQCRMTMQLAGKGCGRSTENCLAIGPLAKPMIDREMMRKIDREEALAIKRNAESEGSITWMCNSTGDPRGNVSCSCCSCCCHGLRAIKDFSVPGLVSRPHFLPEYKKEECTLCEECIEACPMDAWSMAGESLHFDSARCIGCGMCALACEFDAMEMTPVSDAKPPTTGWQKLLLEMTPGYLSNSFRVWAKRLFSPDSYGRQLPPIKS